MQYLPVFIISWKRKKIYYYIPFPRINKKAFYNAQVCTNILYHNKKRWLLQTTEKGEFFTKMKKTSDNNIIAHKKEVATAIATK